MIVEYRKVAVFWVSLLLLLAQTMTAHAEGSREDAARAAARGAGYEGIRAYEDGNMTVAVDKLGRAFAVVKVPTLGLWYARALVKTGKLVEAAERYGEVIRLEVTEGKVKEQKIAQTQAAEELEALQPRIPSLTITVAGASKGCETTLDGEVVEAKLLGLATPVNPGRHHVQAKQGAQLAEQVFELRESEKKTLELVLDPSAATTAHDSSTTSATSTDAKPTAAAGSTSSSRGSTQRTIGWISLGLGGVATAAGIVTGVMAISKRKQLDDSTYCIGINCDPRAHDMLTSYRQMRTLSGVGFIVGAVGLGVGTTLLLTTPKSKETGMSAWIGLGAAGVRGNF